MTSTVTPPSVGVDGPSRTELVRLAAAGAPGTLIIAGCVLPQVAAASAWWLAEQAAARDGRSSGEIRIVRPESGRWTMAEVAAQIAAPARSSAAVRNLIVVEDADRMDSAAFDHLLKTVEEPDAATLFLFAVKSVDAIPATLRGRASEAITLRPAPPSERAGELTGRGIEQGTAERIVELAGAAVAIPARTTPKNTEDVLRWLETAFAQPLGGKEPFTVAAEQAAAVEELAKLTAPDAGARKSVARQLVHTILDGWADANSAAARTGPDSAAVDRIAAGQRAVEQARERVDSYENLTAVLACAHHSASAPARA